MTFKYQCGRVRGSCSTNFNTPTHTDLLSRFNSDALIRKIKFKKSDDFGVYEVEILHDIKNSQIEMRIASFTAHAHIDKMEE